MDDICDCYTVSRQSWVNNLDLSVADSPRAQLSMLTFRALEECLEKNMQCQNKLIISTPLLLRCSGTVKYFVQADFLKMQHSNQMSQLVLSTETCSFGPVFSTNWLICLNVAYLKKLASGIGIMLGYMVDFHLTKP